MPDALLIGILAFLLGLTTLAWTATGLSGLLSHGSWPEHVTFGRTPLAIRSLFSQPHDLAGAWPDTPPGQLSGYGLFWGILISELLILLVLTIFVLGTFSRYRAVRAARRATARASTPPHPGHTAAPSPNPHQPPTVPPQTDQERPEERHTPPRNDPYTPTTVHPSSDDAHPSPDPYEKPQPRPEEATHDVPPAPPSPQVTAPHEAPQPPATARHPAPPIPGSRSTAAPTPAFPTEHRSALPRVLFGTDRHTAFDAATETITAAEGPLVVATTDPALWEATKDARAKLGPLLTYDPQHLLDTPARLRWSPTSGCQELSTATARAAALLAPVRPLSTLDSAVADAAETLLRCWLHAAAVDGRPFRQLHRWAHATGAAQEPVRILRTSPKASPGQAGELESVLIAHAERRDKAKELVARSLNALSSIHIRDACNANRSDALIFESFIDEGGTLYVVGESVEDPRTTPGAMPLHTALLSDVVEHGRRMAERSSDGRLDPPLTLALHDIAALAPLPALPGLLDTGRAQGLLTLATLRSPEQARARWPHDRFPG
ncbi:type VI secretion protein [Streptomyces sp. NPDC003077]|uniref:type VI secretion protein n=1 Tax=Streptomyces sp. NPDC003077 TaxID=3154443 RepID=UPI0033B587BB